MHGEGACDLFAWMPQHQGIRAWPLHGRMGRTVSDGCDLEAAMRTHLVLSVGQRLLPPAKRLCGQIALGCCCCHVVGAID